MTAALRPVPGAPALLLDPRGRPRDRTLVIADLHLGLGGSPARPAGPPEGSAEALVGRLLALGRATGVRAVIVAGDVKHPIVGTPPPLRPVVFDSFATLLAERWTVEVVLGNHDPGLVRHLPREVAVHPTTGAVRSGVGIFHGHRWPSEEVLACRKWVAGHLHPGYRFAPTPTHPDGKRPCWVRVRFPVRLPPRPARRGVRPAGRELVVLPPFNPLAGVEALNRERPARGRSFLYGRFLGRGDARAYLLDGTDLGRLPTASEPRRPVRARSAASAGR